MRRAEWRRQADDPTGLPGWWWRGIAETEWPFHLLASASLGLAAITRMLWIGFVGILAAIASGALRRTRAPDRLKALLPEPAPEGQFRASVIYRRAGLTTGRDEMALVVVDGWLYAEGVRSHFAIRREDVKDMGTGSDRRGWLLLTDGSGIRLSGIGDPARIVLERWRCRPTLIQGEPTFPPASVHVRETARWTGGFMVGMFIGPVLNLCGGLVSSGAGEKLFLLLSGFAATITVIGLGFSRHWKLSRIQSQARQEALVGSTISAEQTAPLQ